MTSLVPVFVALGLLVPVVIRAELWRSCLPAAPDRVTLLRWTAAGFALNQTVGFHSGDALRVALAGRRCGLASAAASVGLLRAIELAALAPLFAVAATATVGGNAAGWALGALAVAALLAAPAAARRLGRGARVLAPLAALDARGMARLAGLSCVSWLAEALLLAGVALALGTPLSIAGACFVLVASVGGQLFAVLPASLGTYEASVAGALAILGHDGAVLWQLPALAHALRAAAAVAFLPFALRRRARWGRAMRGPTHHGRLCRPRSLVDGGAARC